MVKQYDILIAAVLIQEAFRYCSEPCKAQFFIQPYCIFVRFYNRVELQHLETEFFSPFK